MRTTLLIAALLAMALSIAPARAQSLSVPPEAQQGVDKITEGLGDIMGSFQTGDIDTTPKRDTVTLVIGGVAGFVVGSMVSGVINVQVLGLSIVPIAGALLGLYLGNEGYLDGLRNMI